MTITASDMKVGTRYDFASGTQTEHHYATLHLVNATIRSEVKTEGGNTYINLDLNEVELKMLQHQVGDCLKTHEAAKAIQAQAQAQDGAGA